MRDDHEDDGVRVRERRPSFRCPFCRSSEPPISSRKTSIAGWIVFALLVFACIPLCWIGLLMKEDVYTCYDCGMKLGG